MHVDKQRTDECALATIAALAGVSLADVRAIALQFGVVCRWTDITERYPEYDEKIKRRINMRFWNTLKKVARHFGGDNMVYHLTYDYLRSNGRSDTCYVPILGQGPRDLPTNIDELPSKGKGTITICGESGHIAPWKDGLIYNPQNGGKTPQTLTEFKREHADWYVRRITID